MATRKKPNQFDWISVTRSRTLQLYVIFKLIYKATIFGRNICENQ